MRLILIAVFSLTLWGCKTTEPLYHYGEYNNAVYSYFKGEEVTLEEQISVLNQAIETAAAEGKNIAPGVHAHLGMLYFEAGNPEMGAQQFAQEKALFPESEQYIDFLLKSAKGA
ncbi:DUF4810 domain-containing protein [Salinimonas marina]|uniref:DUF4810 domain-containing protein n=1 Tax=Salinimonas marina TaxID=2785918 RepID=A0A7S9HCU9_9ALTE|nr:DUF4810 domain-containing protein [Salinimonas marina]QPG05540.1 DUF4810 domain-containing protein [Salinimonas marina]